MEIKKDKNIFSIVIIIFFVFFMALYFTQITDIYQYRAHNKMSITKEAMERFEKDIENGKDITIDDYLDTVKDYSNGVSKLGYKTSNIVEEFMSKGIKKTFKLLASLFT
jgi:ABC-type dipeptide/oligopeptide/nickel transport system permease component